MCSSQSEGRNQIDRVHPREARVGRKVGSWGPGPLISALLLP